MATEAAIQRSAGPSRDRENGDSVFLGELPVQVSFRIIAFAQGELSEGRS